MGPNLIRFIGTTIVVINMISLVVGFGLGWFRVVGRHLSSPVGRPSPVQRSFRTMPPVEIRRRLVLSALSFVGTVLSTRLFLPVVPGVAAYWWIYFGLTGGNAFLFQLVHRAEAATKKLTGPKG